MPFWGGKRAHFSHGFADEPSAADAATTDEGRKKAEEAHFRHGFTRTDTDGPKQKQKLGRNEKARSVERGAGSKSCGPVK